jgi:hypothetical protein
MATEVDKLTRENEALRKGLAWFEGEGYSRAIGAVEEADRIAAEPVVTDPRAVVFKWPHGFEMRVFSKVGWHIVLKNSRGGEHWADPKDHEFPYGAIESAAKWIEEQGASS